LINPTFQTACGFVGLINPTYPLVLPITAFGSDNTFKPNTPCVDVFCRFVKVGVGIFPTGQ
jgi:hypothetical protein